MEPRTSSRITLPVAMSMTARSARAHPRPLDSRTAPDRVTFRELASNSMASAATSMPFR